MRPAFKKIGNKLAFNNPGADPIFLIVNEVPEGFLYFLETTPFGTVSFVHRELVEIEEEPEEKAAEEPSSKNESSKEPAKPTKK